MTEDALQVTRGALSSPLLAGASRPTLRAPSGVGSRPTSNALYDPP